VAGFLVWLVLATGGLIWSLVWLVLATGGLIWVFGAIWCLCTEFASIDEYWSKTLFLVDHALIE